MTITAEPESTVTVAELAQTGQGHATENGAHPPWCDIDWHDCFDETHTLTWGVPVSGYPDAGVTTRVGERDLGFIIVSRKQVRDGQPFLTIEAPCDPSDPDGLIMTIPEAMELAAGLLCMAVWGKPIRHGNGDEICGGELGTETGISLDDAARWLREMGLTAADMREMAETEPLFAQMAATLSGDPQHV